MVGMTLRALKATKLSRYNRDTLWCQRLAVLPCHRDGLVRLARLRDRRRQREHAVERLHGLTAGRQHLDPRVVREPGARRDQAADDHVLLQPAEVVGLAGNRGLRQYAGGLLERGCRNEAVRRERRLRDAEEHGLGGRGTLALRQHAAVLLLEHELVDQFADDELGVADLLDADPPQHLADDDLDVLVVDRHALQAIDLLHLVDEVALQLAVAEHRQIVVRIGRPVHEGLARLDTVALVNADVLAARDQVLLGLAVVGPDHDLAHALHEAAHLDSPVDLGDDSLLFEARKPKEQAVLTEIDGRVEMGGFVKGMRKIVIRADNGETKEYLIPRGKHISVHEGDRVKAGEALMDGSPNPHDYLAVLGDRELQRYLVNEVQEVYRLQGVTINDKHIEIIVRQMLRRVRIEEVGGTEFVVGELVDKFVFQDENEKAIAAGKPAATAKPVLLGITKASLSTDSFISAASFQETTRVLTEAAISGKTDDLRGLKENVIVGRLIPAGTGLGHYTRVEVLTPGGEAVKPLDQVISFDPPPTETP